MHIVHSHREKKSRTFDSLPGTRGSEREKKYVEKNHLSEVINDCIDMLVLANLITPRFLKKNRLKRVLKKTVNCVLFGRTKREKTIPFFPRTRGRGGGGAAGIRCRNILEGGRRESKRT